MEKENSYLFSFIITAIVLAALLFKRFDFENLKFEKPAIAILYGIGFLISLYFLIRNRKKRVQK